MSQTNVYVKPPREKFVAFGSFTAVFLPISVVFFGSRWLSQIPIGSIFLYDLLLGFTGVVAIITLIVGRNLIPTRSLFFSLSLLVLPALGFLRLVVSGFSLSSVREFAPFLYLVFAWIVALLLPLILPHLVRRGVFVVFGALLAHWLWVVLVRSGMDHILQIDMLGTTVFTVRADIDSTLVGVLGGAILGFATRFRGSQIFRILILGIAVVVLFEVSFFSTRAGHLAASAAVFAFVLSAFFSRAVIKKPKATILVALPVVWILLLVMPLFSGGLGERYAGLTEQVQASTAGTATARLNSWVALLTWLAIEPIRLVVGVGFGSGYMFQSGALEKLIGPSAVFRAEEGIGPHNFLLFVTATMGLAVMLYFLGIILLASFFGIRSMSRESSMIHPLAVSVLVAIVVASLFGVVFEAPHGAIPLAWALGILFAGFGRRKTLSDSAKHMSAIRH